MKAAVYTKYGPPDVLQLKEIEKPLPKDLDYFIELFEAGRVKPVIDRCYPLKDVSGAFRFFQEGQFKGKIVINGFET